MSEKQKSIHRCAWCLTENLNIGFVSCNECKRKIKNGYKWDIDSQKWLSAVDYQRTKTNWDTRFMGDEPVTTDTQMERMREQILERIDFLSDHWVNGDDKPPFSFGGWRDEVANALVDIFETHLTQVEREALANTLRCPHCNQGQQDGMAGASECVHCGGDGHRLKGYEGHDLDEILDELSKEALQK